MASKTLVLNKCETPVSIVKAQRAIVLVNCDKAVVRAVYEGTLIRSAGCDGYDFRGSARNINPVISMPIPAVIQCTKSDYFPKKYTNTLPFTRQNVYIRDHGHCQYCGKKVSLSEFTFDHVVPQSLGGITRWDNVVIACVSCNGAKGNKPVGKFKTPLREPYAPKLNKAAPSHMVSRLASEMPHKTWLDWVYWHVVLES